MGNSVHWFGGSWRSCSREAYAPQARVMHEMGHIAVHKANPFKSIKNFCYPNQRCDQPSWYPSNPEWRADAFNEGIASFIASVALYRPEAVAPHNCVGIFQSACINEDNNLERSNGASCALDEDRWPLSTERFLWDIYDDVREDYVVAADYDRRPFHEFFDRLADYPDGLADHNDDEPWGDSARTVVDNYDGRSGEDMKYWFDVNGFNPFNQRALNCNP